MKEEHETAAKELTAIRTLTNGYALPDDACATYSLLFSLLDDFEQDFILHAHLENNILFPKTLSLEEEGLKTDHEINQCQL